MIFLRTLRARLAAWIALAVMTAALFHAGAAVFVFLLHERTEAQGELAVTPEGEEAENRAVVLELAGSMALIAAAAAVAAAIAGLWLAGKALAPLGEAADRARAAQAGSAELLLPVRGTDDEWDRLAAVVNELLRDQQRSTERARSFSANAAHELRTPLTAMLGEVQVTLRRDRTPEEYRTALKGVESEVSRLGAVVEALLVLARADSGEMSVRAESFDLAAVAVEAARGERLDPGAVRVQPGPPPLARGDPLLTRRVLDNLIENAIRHGGKEIEVSVARDAGVVRVSVTDDGPGLGPAVRSRLFERFNREPGASDGHGLGLAIAQALTSAQGGALRLDDSARRTSFVLELPSAA